ncbi:MAG: EAL domain-containing protein [Magnetospirillum sp.]|nr:EAL domain-containing protein [Magnetospirillum sp.]
MSKDYGAIGENRPAADGTKDASPGDPGGLTAEAQAHLEGLASVLPGIAFRREMAPDGTITYSRFNEAVRDLLGVDPAAMAADADGCLAAVHRADCERHIEAIRRSASTLDMCREEFRMVTAAGEVRWFRGASRPRRGGGGTIVWDGVLTDITDARRAEFRLDMLMEHAADAIFLLDARGVIDSANAAAGRLFGYEPGELAGRPFGVLLPEDQRWLPLLKADGEDGGIVGGGARELVGLRNDGTTFPLELSTEEVRLEGQRQFVAIGRDVTQRRQTQAALRETEERLRAIAANLPGMVFQRVLRANGRLEYTFVSEGCRDVLGVEPEELIADPQLFMRVLSLDERQRFLASLGHSARTMEPLEEEMAVAGIGGGRRWLRGQSRPSLRDSGDIVWDGMLLDVTDRKLAEQRLSFLAYYDPLTRLPNRAAFLERFADARDSARRGHSLLGILSLGIDRFGVINATMGHSVGDQVLRAVADVLQAGLGRGDVMARTSGDRFLVLVTGIAARRHLQEVMERLHELAQATVTVAGEQFDISASGGAAIYPRDGEDAEILIRNADAALQRAKAQEPGSLKIFSKEMSSKAARTLNFQAKLRRAVDNGELIPYFQPQVDLRTGAVVGMEALVRWNSPDMGMVAPGEFIPLAEESNLIDAICDVMLLESCRQNKEWQDRGLPPIPVAVNVSGRQFQYPRRLIGALETALTKTGLAPRYLEIELTESSAMRDPDNAIQVVKRVNEMGIACAIDDFGTGYSSLSVLKRFPIQKLKIDRSFVMDITSDPNDAAIVEAIIAMARALKLVVLAEGVEHRSHLEFLRALGCDQMQGYFFSRPLAARKMVELLAEGRALHLGTARPRNPVA